MSGEKKRRDRRCKCEYLNTMNRGREIVDILKSLRIM